MTPEIQTESSVYEKTTWERVTSWMLIEGDRRVVASGITVGIIGIVGVLLWGDMLAVGPDSAVDSLFSSGSYCRCHNANYDLSFDKSTSSSHACSERLTR